MDADVKARWVEALRSGRYKQGVHALRTKNDYYCCLGVFCDVLGEEWVESEEEGEPKWAVRDGSGLNPAYLPRRISGPQGLENTVPDEMEPWTKHFYLARMNDTGKSFAVIADWIEANL